MNQHRFKMFWGDNPDEIEKAMNEWAEALDGAIVSASVSNIEDTMSPARLMTVLVVYRPRHGIMEVPPPPPPNSR